ncbi:hypothetical protein MC885_004456 [Smutsia gigantea]|nr:hypothetical protein MC885_004456 [Smutsia gigantea]
MCRPLEDSGVSGSSTSSWEKDGPSPATETVDASQDGKREFASMGGRETTGGVGKGLLKMLAHSAVVTSVPSLPEGCAASAWTPGKAEEVFRGEKWAAKWLQEAMPVVKITDTQLLGGIWFQQLGGGSKGHPRAIAEERHAATRACLTPKGGQNVN